MMRLPNDTFSSLPSFASFSFFTLTACQRPACPVALTGILAAVGYFLIEVMRFRFRGEHESDLGVLVVSLAPREPRNRKVLRTSPCHEWKKGLSWLYSISLGSSCSQMTPWLDCDCQSRS